MRIPFEYIKSIIYIILSLQKLALACLSPDAADLAERKQTLPPDKRTLTFDPFVAAFSRRSTVGVQGMAESQYRKLTEARRAMLHTFDSIAERNLVLLLPSAQVPPTLVDESESLAGGLFVTDEKEIDVDLAMNREEEEVYDLTDEDAAAVVLLTLNSRKVEQSPTFQSRAVNDLQRLRATPVYPYALVRIRFPDGVILQGRFNPLTDTMASVYYVVQQSISSHLASSSFVLYSPYASNGRRMQTVFTDEPLSAVGEGPARMIHLKWVGLEGSWKHRDLISSVEVLNEDLVREGVDLRRAKRFDYPQAQSLANVGRIKSSKENPS